MQKLNIIANDIDVFSTLPFCPKVRVLVALMSLVREPKFPSSLKVSLPYLFYYITYIRIMSFSSTFQGAKKSIAKKKWLEIFAVL